MAPGEPADDAAVFDFLDEFLRDLERGEKKPLVHYLARYRGHEEAVASEYFAELQRSGITPSREDAPAAGPPGAAPSADPSRVGPYRLLRELGRGGQGAVWLAEDTRLSRKVALKLLPTEFAAFSQERRRRLQREAEVIARLDHPSLCAVIEAEIDGERPYLAMRYVEGATLGEWIARAREARRREREEGVRARREGPLAMFPRNALEQAGLLAFFERTARALHAAHEAGVVHRDVKPQNLMVTPAGDPVVLDFGQARDDSSESFELTRSGDVMGTPAYMSPEQILGKREAIDRRTDVWSLGASLFEALSLARPFEGDNVMALFLAVRSAALPDLRALNPAIPAELAVVVATALDKDPARRYSSALEFAEDLRRVREYEPIRARPPSAWRVFRGWFQRHPALAYGTLGSIVALSLGLVSSLTLLVQKNVALTEKTAALSHALGSHLARRADALLEEHPAAALRLGIEAVERAPTFETRASLFRALQACHLRALIDGSPARLATESAISPDGASVAVAFEGLPDSLAPDARARALLRIFDLESGRERCVVPGIAKPVRALAFSPDGARLAFADEDGVVRTCDARTGEILDERPGLAGAGRALVYAADGTLVAACEERVAAFLPDGAPSWSLAWSDLASTPLAPGGEVLVALPPQGSRALLARSNTHAATLARLIDVEGGAPLAEIASPAAILCAEFSADGSALVTGDDAGGLCLWRAADGGLERRIELPSAGSSPERNVRLARFAPDGQKLVALLQEEDRARAWLVWTATGAATPLGEADVRVLHAAWSPEGRTLATVGSDMLLRLWSGSDGRAEDAFRGIFAPREVEWTRDGRRLLTRGNGATLSVWYAGARPDVFALRAGSARVNTARFAPDGERAVVAGDDGMARVWSTPSGLAGAGGAAPREPGELLATFAHRGPVRSASFSPDGGSVATAGDDGDVRVFPSAGGEPRILLEAGEPLAGLEFGGDGSRVATRSQSGRVFLLDVSGAREPRELETGTPVGEIHWLAGGTELLAACVGRNVVRRFSGEDGRLLGEWSYAPSRNETARAHVERIASSRDGGEVALACADGVVRMFEPLRGIEDRIELTIFPAQSIHIDAAARRLLVVGRAGRGAVRLQDLETSRGLHRDGGRNVRPGETRGEIGSVVYHTGDVTGGALSPDGRWVITTGKEGSAYVRSAEDGSAFAFFPGRGGACSLGTISPGPGPARAMVAFEDGSVWVWPLDPLPAARAREVRLQPELVALLVQREKRIALPLEYEPMPPANAR